MLIFNFSLLTVSKFLRAYEWVEAVYIQVIY